jgi:hypothetical protein
LRKIRMAAEPNLLEGDSGTAATPDPGKAEYANGDLTAVHINVPKVLWRAVDAMAKRFATSKTNIVIRALNKEAYFARIQVEDPNARVIVEHSDGRRETVVFV